MTARPTKTDALIRDVAKLFVTYSPTVWRPVLDDLARAGGSYGAIAQRLEELLAKSIAAPKPRRRQAAKKPSSAGPRTAPSDQMALEFSPDRQATLSALATALSQRRLLPTAADIRHVYLESGGKGDLPKTRKAAIHHLLRHLNGIPGGSFGSVHDAVRQHGSGQDAAGDYQRWFRLIRKP